MAAQHIVAASARKTMKRDLGASGWGGFLIDHHHYYYYLRCIIVLGLKQFSFYKTKPKVLFVIAASERR